ERETSRVFGAYNLIGYGAASVGAFAASTPSYFQNDLLVFRSLYLVYGFVGLLLIILYRLLGNLESVGTESKRIGIAGMSPKAKRDLTRLTAFFSIDAFGGGFVSQSLLAYWFYLAYNTSLESLGIIFLVANVITALSTFGASLLAEHLGNLRTMVYTHLLSNALLVSVPLAGTLTGSVLFLFLRQTVSQMDVPTRQAFMAQVFTDQDRISANAITNTLRSVSSILGAPISGLLFAAGFIALPILAGGLSKIFYDLTIFSAYRKEVK
ncbi:MAG: MFS transporter, partial [Thaumarchaeota archaeon]|nr:MFS transporter [Nitrososphaerota archaeon]